MLAKSLKSVIVLAVTLAFFGGTAMADRWERNCHQTQKWHHYQPKHHAQRYHDYGRPVYVAPARPHYRQPESHASSLHSLAPRIVIIGGLPFPVPPPPNEVLDYLTGR